MTGILKSLIGKNRKQPAKEEVEALQRANQVLQYRVQIMTQAVNAGTGRAA